MSASLTYATAGPVDNATKASILDFVKRETNGYPWWAESILFYDDPARPGHIVGTTKLFLLIDDPAIDSFMASSDMNRIVQALESASAKFGMGWHLFLQENPAGTVDKGMRDKRAGKAINDLLSICEDMGTDPAELDRAK